MLPIESTRAVFVPRSPQSRDCCCSAKTEEHSESNAYQSVGATRVSKETIVFYCRHNGFWRRGRRGVVSWHSRINCPRKNGTSGEVHVSPFRERHGKASE